MAGTYGEELEAVITDPKVDVFGLYMGGVPAGFFELGRRANRDEES